MKKALYILLLSLVPLSATAQDGTEVFPFTRIERDPAAAGMAGAGFALTDGTAYATFRNPAAIVMGESTFQVGAAYQKWAPNLTGDNQINAGASVKIGKRFGLAAGFARDLGAEYTYTVEGGKPSGVTAKPRNTMMSLGLAAGIGDQVGLGANVHYYMERLDNGKPKGVVAADAYAMYRFGGATVAAGVTALGGKVEARMGGKKYTLPASAKLAAAYTLDLDKHVLTGAADFDYFFSGAMAAAVGLSYGFNDMVFVRGGYHAGIRSVVPSYASAGLGVRFAGVSLDAAFLTASKEIGNTFTVGLGYRF